MAAVTGADQVDVLSAELLERKAAVDEAKEALKKAESEYSRVEADLAEAMKSTDHRQLQANGLYFTLKTDTRWSIAKDARAKVLEQFKQYQPDLVTESVHPTTLAKFANKVDGSDLEPGWWAAVRAFLERKTTSKVAITKNPPK